MKKAGYSSGLFFPICKLSGSLFSPLRYLLTRQRRITHLSCILKAQALVLKNKNNTPGRKTIFCSGF
jgi:hypothetical protein